MAKFQTGRHVTTPGAYDFAMSLEGLSALGRHMDADWGEVSDDDKAANDAALLEGGRLFSKYTIDGQPVWIITEADRAYTTILLPEEY